jgi:hypothetical protein
MKKTENNICIESDCDEDATLYSDRCEDCAYEAGEDLDYEPEPREDFGFFGEAGLWD